MGEKSMGGMQVENKNKNRSQIDEEPRSRSRGLGLGLLYTKRRVDANWMAKRKKTTRKDSFVGLNRTLVTLSHSFSIETHFYEGF